MEPDARNFSHFSKTAVSNSGRVLASIVMYVWDVSLHRGIEPACLFGIYFSLELGLKLAETSTVPLVVLVPEVST